MFRCEVTGKLSKPGDKMNKIVVEKRDKEYKDPETGEVIGRGWEIVKEISATDEGVKIWNQRNAQ
jgi:hypothetical protein